MFSFYPDVEYPLAAAQLILAMLGMGTTLRPADFWGVARAPKGIVLVLATQYALAPLLAMLAARALELPAGIAVGMVLVAGMPSGSLSTVFAHLGRGNTALAISAAAISTLLCLVATPLVLETFAKDSLPADLLMPIGTVAFEIVFLLLLPLAVGLLIGRYAPERKTRIGKWCIRGSLAVLAAIVVGSLGSGRLDLSAYGWRTPASLAAFAVWSYVLARAVAFAARCDSRDGYTVGMGVLLRNCNLAVLVKASLFLDAAAGASGNLPGGVLFVALFYGGASLVVAGVFTAWQRRRDKDGEPPAESAGE